MNSIKPRDSVVDERIRTSSQDTQESRSRMSSFLLKNSAVKVNPRFLECVTYEQEFIKTVTDLASNCLDANCKTLNILTDAGKGDELLTLIQHVASMQHVSEGMFVYLADWAKAVQKGKGKEDPLQKVSAFISTTKNYLTTFDMFVEAVNDLKAVDHTDKSLMALFDSMHAPFIRALELRYALRMGQEKSVAKRLAANGVNEAYTSLKTICGDILTSFEIADDFQAIADLEDRLCKDLVMHPDGSKVKGHSITHIAKPVITTTFNLSVSPTLTLPAHSFLRIDKIIYDQDTKSTKNTGIELRFYVLSECVVVTQVDKTTRKEMLMYAPIEISRLKIIRLPEQPCRFDLKICGAGLLAMWNDDKALVAAFIDLVEMHQANSTATKGMRSNNMCMIEGPSSLPCSVVNSVQCTPKKPAVTVQLAKLKPSSLISMVSLIPNIATQTVSIPAVIPAVEFSEPKLKANEIVLRELPTDKLILGIDQAHNQYVKDAAIKALSDPETTKTMEEIVTDLRTPLSVTCIIYRFLEDTREYEKIGKRILNLTREASGAAYITFNDLVTGRASHSGRVGVQVNVALRKEFIIFYFSDKKITARFVSVEEAERICGLITAEQDNAVVMLHSEILSKGLIDAGTDVCEKAADTDMLIRTLVIEIGEMRLGSIQVQRTQENSDTVAIDGKFTLSRIIVSSIQQPACVFLNAPITKAFVCEADADSVTLRYNDKAVKLFAIAADLLMLQETLAKSCAANVAILAKSGQYELDQQAKEGISPVKRIDHNLFFTSRLRKTPSTPQLSNPDQHRASSNTLTDSDPHIPSTKHTPMPRSIVNQRRPSLQPTSTYTKEHAASYVSTVDGILERLHNRIRDGLIDQDTCTVFQAFVAIPKNDIFESKVLSTIYIAKMTQIIGELLGDDLKQREQLARLKPTGTIAEKLSLLASQGVVN